ncbi:type I DNA topoisomerase [Membranicola marinus]|uniref:DNA topoisomerase 1 n=1 Tax=Membranihabitans marinus TaxID=1227546 RepID=A0A953L899_9BACT|nr:type I DNA topoisomerase [Membranihabitans marinus]MBY5957465.1 type I DNA topoisomerase [Membranihabitans marinus]
MSKKLVIVESPAKAKTIEKFLGKNYIVKSSYGHVRDLEKGNNAVDVEHNFKPKYAVSPEKKKVVKELKSMMKKVDEVVLATDEDREGEAISWHLCEVLGLDPKTTERIVFREITKSAIQKAINNPRTVDEKLVDAQQARRILDRLVGFELSEILWKKIKGKLSAGRVQSVAVKLVVEREREINNFEITNFFKVSALFKLRNEEGKWVELKAEYPQRLSTLDEAKKFLEDCKPAEFTIANIEVKPLKRKPAPPFTTSTLQQEASRKLNFAVKRTMMTAQRLYEAGHISYMRTDSIALSNDALGSIGRTIEQEYGSKYHQVRKYKNKSGSSQEAHEAIRPTNFNQRNLGTDSDQKRLYELIWKRTVASQMADAKLEKTTVDIDISTRQDDQLRAEGEVLIFDGFLKLYIQAKDDDDDEQEEAKGMLPPLQKGQQLDLKSMTGKESFTRPPARFTEASLVKKLEEQGIGRPSTYAPTISKIMEEGRGYVVKESREGEKRSYAVLTLSDGKINEKNETETTGATKNRLYPTDMGMVVTDFLDEHFEKIMNYNFTANIEKEFDEIAEGTLEWQTMLAKFYGPFHENVNQTLEEADRFKGERLLGKDPETGLQIIARISRFGKPLIQKGHFDEIGEEEKPDYANLRPGQSIETITLEEALKLFDLPRDFEPFEDKAVMVNVGRYGPYVKWGDQFISLPRGEDPFEVTQDRAYEIIREKKKADEPIMTYKGEPVTQGKGRFGPFLKINKIYVNIPKKYDPDNLTQDEMIELIEKKLEKEANRYIQKWDKEKVALENGRWGPFIRYKRKSISLPKKADGEKYTKEDLMDWTLEDVMEIVNKSPKK